MLHEAALQVRKPYVQYDPNHKPDPKVCPRQFCFMWQMARVITPQTPEPVTIAEGCRCPLGICTRLNPQQSDQDGYESHEPNLQKAGLPWFYFISSPDNLVENLHEAYIRESEALWGEGHWRNDAEENATPSGIAESRSCQ